MKNHQLPCLFFSYSILQLYSTMLYSSFSNCHALLVVALPAYRHIIFRNEARTWTGHGRSSADGARQADGARVTDGRETAGARGRSRTESGASATAATTATATTATGK